MTITAGQLGQWETEVGYWKQRAKTAEAAIERFKSIRLQDVSDYISLRATLAEREKEIEQLRQLCNLNQQGVDAVMGSIQNTRREMQRAESLRSRLATAREFMRHKCTCALFRGSETNTRPVAEKICDCGYVTALAATEDSE